MSNAASELQVLESTPHQLYIDGQWCDAARGGTFPVEDPAVGRTLVEVADGGPEDALRALNAATTAQPSWAATAPRVRGEILHRTYTLLLERIEELSLLMTLEMGKPLSESRAEIKYAAEFLRWFSEEAVRIEGSYMVEPNGLGRLLVTRQPVGPCLLITPWNFPMAMATRKIAPALAAGCTAVIKPAELTPLSTLALTQILIEAGLPAGVLNVITTSDASATTSPLIRDRRLRKLSFTGSTEVGKKLMADASENLLRVSMELGGNAAFIVFADADLDLAVDGAILAKMRNIGEACTAANRLYVQEPVAEEFARRLTERLGSMVVGRGTEPGVEVGPLITSKARNKLAELVDDATGRGARIVTGGRALAGDGYFFAPTVLVDVPPDARMLHEEIFGPIAPVVTFTADDEVIELTNSTEYGLVAYLFTSNLDRAVRVSESLEVGMVGLNQGLVSNPAAPFGGVKHSGFGREGGSEGILEYLNVKYVAIHVGE